jgi:two-component system KDP operon response regulator KdpE
MLTTAEAPIAASAAKQASMTAAALVLVVEDELPMQKLLRIVLRNAGMRTEEATSGAEALERAAACNHDLILLDLGLPDSDGIDVARRLRECTAAPILVISARGRDLDKVAALDAGANDYLTKPFAHSELRARVRAWLPQTARVAHDREESVLEAGDLRIDLARRRVCVGGREVELTPTEYKLFATLICNRGRVMTHRQLLEAAWGPRYANDRQYLRLFMAQLRRKVEHDAALPRHLLTELGVGYRLRAE